MLPMNVREQMFETYNLFVYYTCSHNTGNDLHMLTDKFHTLTRE